MIGVFWKSSYSSDSKWNLIKECSTKSQAKEIEKKESIKNPNVLIFTGVITKDERYDI